MRRLAGIFAMWLACSAEPPSQRDDRRRTDPDDPIAVNYVEPDEAPSRAPDPPQVTDLPARTSLGTAALRGSTTASRVVIIGGPTNVMVPVLPTGQFCADLPLANGTNTFEVVALADGLVSDAVEIEVTRDMTAPVPTSPICSGQQDSPCAAAEICGNSTDDDCNGLADGCDSACSGCADDIYQPNHGPFDVPILLPGSHNLKLCPCRNDWFALVCLAKDTIHATAVFNSSQVDLDMRLFRAADAESDGTSLAFSTSSTGVEEIEHVVAEAGTYYLWVYADGPSQATAYALSISPQN